MGGGDVEGLIERAENHQLPLEEAGAIAGGACRPAFVGEESVAIITQHLNTLPVAPSWHRPDLPPALEVLILRLLEKEPVKRPASAAEVRRALAAVDLTPDDLTPGPFPRAY